MRTILIILSVVFVFFSCKKVDEEEINEKSDILVDHLWGIPIVVYGNSGEGSIFLYEPIDFDDNGTVTIASQYVDYWEFINEQTIRFIEIGLNWQILNINDSAMHVNVMRTENSEFLFECTYQALD